MTENTTGNVDGCSVNVIQEINTHNEIYDFDRSSYRQECTINLSALPDTAVKLRSWTPTLGANPQWRVQFDSVCPLYIAGDAAYVDSTAVLQITFPSKSDAEQWRSGVLDAVHSNCKNGR